VRKRLLDRVQVGYRLGKTLLDPLPQFIGRIAIAEHRIHLAVQRAHRVLPVLRRLRAQHVGQRRVDVLLQGLDARVPALLDAAQVEVAQLLDAPVDLVDRALERRLVVDVARLRCFARGHALSPR
jgi:hypothetical protein